MTRPTIYEDIGKIVGAAVLAGDDPAARKIAANTAFTCVVKERGLLRWEVSVLREKAQMALIEAGLWTRGT